MFSPLPINLFFPLFTSIVSRFSLHTTSLLSTLTFLLLFTLFPLQIWSFPFSYSYFSFILPLPLPSSCLCFPSSLSYSPFLLSTRTLMIYPLHSRKFSSFYQHYLFLISRSPSLFPSSHLLSQFLFILEPFSIFYQLIFSTCLPSFSSSSYLPRSFLFSLSPLFTVFNVF